ncbi:hypothetical protein GCM10007862_34270 [Dyella lipolytica]|nr:hypothetical protein GCM10007862_34270 [Dyella lipolytica]
MRVEYSGIGPCEKIASKATAVHSGSQGHKLRRSSDRRKLWVDTCCQAIREWVVVILAS